MDPDVQDLETWLLLKLLGVQYVFSKKKKMKPTQNCEKVPSVQDFQTCSPILRKLLHVPYFFSKKQKFEAYM